MGFPEDNVCQNGHVGRLFTPRILNVVEYYPNVSWPIIPRGLSERNER
jgi:hypothetical protein